MDNFLKPIQLLKQSLPRVFSTPLQFHKIPWSKETTRIMNLLPKQGIFHTGIESSDPFVEGERRNQLKEAHDFFNNYEERLDKISDLGIKWLRFGIPYSMAHIGPGQYDFSLFQNVLKKTNELGITIIADLLHFGLPDWLHAENSDQPFFQNSKFPEAFAEYAEKFALEFPSIRFYTVINEPFVTANLSAKVGLWNETKNTQDWRVDVDFVKATSNIARAAILARKKIEQVWVSQKRETELLFVQNESFELAIANPDSHREGEAKRFNLRRYAALDLIFGYHDPVMEQYLIEQGMSKSEYNWCMENGNNTKTILGIDHYPWCVYVLDDEGQELDPLRRYQLYELSKVYYDRYKLPLLHTEINGPPELAVEICQLTHEAIVRLREEGYPVLGMGWYGDEYQVGWQNALAGPNKFDEYKVGLYYKGELQPVASLFNEMLQAGFKPTKSNKFRNLLKRR